MLLDDFSVVPHIYDVDLNTREMANTLFSFKASKKLAN
jgi:hypothetical protein